MPSFAYKSWKDQNAFFLPVSTAEFQELFGITNCISTAKFNMWIIFLTFFLNYRTKIMGPKFAPEKTSTSAARRWWWNSMGLAAAVSARAARWGFCKPPRWEPLSFPWPCHGNSGMDVTVGGLVVSCANYTHTIHGTGIFTYMNFSWFLWFSCR